jgi:chromosome partitioning protein
MEAWIMAIVGVVCVKGGTGKSSTILNLLHALGLDEVVHLDKRGGLLNLDALRPEPIKCIHSPQNEDELLALLATDTKDSIMLLDCGGYDDTIGRLAMANADILIVPSNDTALEQLGMIDTSKVMKEISLELGREIIGHALLNRVHPSRRDFGGYDSLLDSLGNYERIPVVIPLSAPVTSAMMKGGAVTSGNMAYRYQLIAKYIKTKLIDSGALNE